MQSFRIGPLQRALLLTLLAAGVITGGYFALRYTLLADVREALSAVDTTDAIAHGETLFQTRGCANCHTLERANAVGDTGPNLTGIASRQTTDYIYQSIQSPTAVIATGCPEGPCEPVMPNFGSILDETQIQALVAYLSQP